MEKKKETVLELLKRKSQSGYEEFDLPISGITVKINFFSAKTARMCQEIAQSGDSVNEDLLWGAMIAESCVFNGEKLIAEDIIQYLHGVDYMHLLGKLSGVESVEGK